MQKLLIKWRFIKFDAPVIYPTFSQNGGYTLSFRYNSQRKWYVDNAGVNILDTILEGKYLDTGKVSLLARKDKCFAVIEFDETKITADELAFDIEHDFSDYGIRTLTKLEAIDYLKDFTTCTETLANIFELRAEYIDPATSLIVPAYLLNLN